MPAEIQEAKISAGLSVPGRITGVIVSKLDGGPVCLEGGVVGSKSSKCKG